jgi:hypothetical protein
MNVMRAARFGSSRPYRNLIKGYGRKRSSPDFRLKPRSHRAQRMQPVELARHKAKKVLG